MAVVIAVAQQKGGAGKSTIAANLAVALAQAGHRAALLDTDPQKSLERWNALRQQRPKAVPLDFHAPAGWRVTGTLDRLRRAAEMVVVDTPPHVETDARLVIRAADLVLVPLQPSLPDLWASDATVELAEKEKRRWAYVLNRMPASGRLRDVILAEIARRGAPVFEPHLGNRSAYPAAFAQGLGVTEASPRNPAAAEIAALASALAASSLGGLRRG
ncbi:MAG: ParA family protein [Acetobacteraceae bacterium]|nr:ParA family protein [Acetobacteraceae bacterium]